MPQDPSDFAPLLFDNVRTDRWGAPVRLSDVMVAAPHGGLAKAFKDEVDRRLNEAAGTPSRDELKAMAGFCDVKPDELAVLAENYGTLRFLDLYASLFEKISLMGYLQGAIDDLGRFKVSNGPTPVQYVMAAEVYTVILTRAGLVDEYLCARPQAALSDDHIKAVAYCAPHYARLCAIKPL